MFDYYCLRAKGNHVSQTINDPIMIVDFWELGDAFAALFIILVFGIMFYSWGLMSVLLFFALFVAPIIKRNSNRGVFLHLPYRILGMSLPGLANPKGERKYSD